MNVIQRIIIVFSWINYSILAYTIQYHVSHRLYSMMMNQDQSLWHKTSIESNTREAVGLRKIVIKTNKEIVNSYSNPGQYVQIRPSSASSGDNNEETTVIKPGFYAMASPPSKSSDDDLLTFLVKETDNNRYLSQTNPGLTVDMSLAQGKGFPIEEYFNKYKFDFPVTNILMLACGSGLAPIAAAIDSGLLGLGKPNFNSLFKSKAILYLGCRTPDHIPFRDRLDLWAAQGVTVIPVISQPSDGYNGRKGYVQDALKMDGISVPRNTGALLCGQRGMVESAKRQLLEAGVFEGRVLLNF